MTKFTFAQREEGFDNHINASIRGYSDLLNDVLDISEYFIEDQSTVVDIGCSTGKLLKQMIERNDYAKSVTYIGVEVEDDFYSTYEDDEMRQWSSGSSFLRYHRGDVRSFCFPKECSLITSVFTLQFMPEKDRDDLVQTIYDSLRYGGAFVFAEKTISTSAKIHEIRTFTYYDYKRQNFEAEDILTKEKELRHMLKPNTRSRLIESCERAGFDSVEIDSFWQNHAFTGFIAIKR